MDNPEQLEPIAEPVNSEAPAELKLSPHPGGRPRIEIDLESLKLLAAGGMSMKEIAACLGLSVATLGRRFEEAGSSFEQVYQAGVTMGIMKATATIRKSLDDPKWAFRYMSYQGERFNQRVYLTGGVNHYHSGQIDHIPVLNEKQVGRVGGALQQLGDFESAIDVTPRAPNANNS